MGNSDKLCICHGISIVPVIPDIAFSFPDVVGQIIFFCHSSQKRAWCGSTKDHRRSYILGFQRLYAAFQIRIIPIGRDRIYMLMTHKNDPPALSTGHGIQEDAVPGS
jgi:hypothetical protein